MPRWTEVHPAVAWPEHLTQAVTLSAGPYRATVAPAWGGRLTALTCEVDGRSVPLIVPMAAQGFAPHRWPKAGAFPMVPFANRLPAGRFSFGARTLDLPSGPDGGPQHGFGHRRTWTLTHCSPAAVRMVLLHDGRSEGWPWAFEAQLAFQLSEAGCEMSLTLTNLDHEHPMPVAAGWHPYHPFAPTRPRDHRVYAPTQKVRRLDDTGAAGCALAAHVEHIATPPATTVALEHWQQRASWGATDPSAEVVIHTTGFAHAVVHRPSSGDYLCVEPVAALPGTLRSDHPDLDRLPPGSTHVATWRCALES